MESSSFQQTNKNKLTNLNSTRKNKTIELLQADDDQQNIFLDWSLMHRSRRSSIINEIRFAVIRLTWFRRFSFSISLMMRIEISRWYSIPFHWTDFEEISSDENRTNKDNELDFSLSFFSFCFCEHSRRYRSPKILLFSSNELNQLDSRRTQQRLLFSSQFKSFLTKLKINRFSFQPTRFFGERQN